MAPTFPIGKVYPVPTIDLNADLGEGCGSDEELLALVSSASIACGAHAGDERIMRATIDAAAARGVSIGAHPGYPDRAGLGRIETGATPAEIRELVLRQLEVFAAACGAAGAAFRHVKPHGALYNRAMTDAGAAESIAGAVAAFDPALAVLCMPGSELLRAAQAAGLAVAREAFLDRAYESATVLVPRTAAGATISDPSAAAERAERMVLARVVPSADGTELAIEADSLCVHGDNPGAVALLRAVRFRLEAAGVTIAPLHPA
ncbi:MAG: LamB/YcsF family protein [Gemmatimonadaceae bacterium]|nr:LamB/YcsF family protein [Gemmatimonadaceae bacterium]